MAVFKNFTLSLDSPRSVYYPGQVITGSLEIELERPLTFSVLYVKFLGEAVVQWTEEESEKVNGNKRFKNVEYVGREEYFKGSQLLAGSYGSVINLEPGISKYKFQYQLPRKAPSSFEGERGAVKYSVSAHMEFQRQDLLQERIFKYFSIVAPFDLNKGNEFVREPIEMEFEEVYNCGCFCSSDPMNIRVRLPVSAYCPGQVIPVEVAVENKSSIEISGIIFEILTREKYKTQRPIAEYIQPEVVLTTLKKGSIMSGTTRNFTAELAVPEIIAVNLEDCSIIDVGYFFRITIKLSGCNDDLQDEAEICLGLIPLTETVEGTYVHPLAHSLPVDPIPPIDVHVPEANVTQTPVQSGYPTVQSGYPTVQSGYQTVPDGTSYFVQVKQQVTSSDPSQNYQMGFQASYPPGSDIPPAYNPQFQLNQPWGITMPDINRQNLGQDFNLETMGFNLKLNGNNVQTFSNVTSSMSTTVIPRGKSPVPSAPPL